MITLQNKHNSRRHKATRSNEHPEKRSESKMETAGFEYSWRKMEMVAQDGKGWRKVVCGLCFTRSNKA